MKPGVLPAPLLWVVDRESIENGALPRAVCAGARWLYLRDASIEPDAWRRELAELSASGGLAVVVNGAPGWARDDGLGAHLKASQPPLGRGDRAAWPLLGRSVHDRKETGEALADRPDYLIAGPLFPTASKPGHAGIGTHALAEIVARARGTPVFAIGGITPANLPNVLAVGVCGVAVRSGITAATDPASATHDYLRALPGDPS